MDLSFLPLATTRAAPDDEPCITIDDVCATVDNGDVILFSGESRISILVTLFCGSQYSHIAIVYKESSMAAPMLFESVKSDDDPKKPVGVRLLPLREVLENFHGNAMAVRHLTIPIELPLSDQGVVGRWRDHLRSTMRDCVKAHLGKSYESRTLNFIFSRFTAFVIHYETQKRLFCSELVAICYQAMGILDASHSCIQFTPDDFCEAGEMHLQMPTSVAFHTIRRTPVTLGPQLFIQQVGRAYDSSDDDSDSDYD